MGPSRLGEYHIGVRFGDGGRDWVVTLDGVEVQNDCVELLAGDPGVVVLMFRSLGGSPRWGLWHGKVIAIRDPERLLH